MKPDLPDEPRLPQALRTVLGRAAARPLRTLGAAALVTILAVAVRAQLPSMYSATVTFRLREGDLQDQRSAPRPPARIREYVSSVALSRERLLDLAERHDLQPRLRVANPELAVTLLRERLEVDVVRNYFLLDRRESTDPRTALVVISYSDSDRDRAAAVIHDLGELLVDHERSGRLELLGSARASAERAAALARDLVRGLRARDGAVAGAATGRLDPRTVADHDAELVAALRRVELLERRASALELSRLAEESMLGLSFERVDERVRAGREPLTLARGGLLALGGFALFAPLAAVVLGAFDSRVYRAADVTAAGFPLLGDLTLLPAGSRRVRRRGEATTR